MNKAELVDRIAERVEVTKKVIDAVVIVTLESIMETVASGEKVTLVGFGTFDARNRRAREGRNPRTGSKMVIPATTVPWFSAGKIFKERVAPDK